MKCWDKIKSWFGGSSTKTKAEKPPVPKKAKESVSKVTPPSKPAETKSADTPK